MRQLSKVFSYSFKRTGLRVALPSLALFGAVSAASFAPDYTRYLDTRSTSVEPYAAADSTMPIAVRPAPAPASDPSLDPGPKPPGAFATGLSQPRVDGWIHRLSTSLKSDFQQSLNRMGKYTGMITAKLDERGMPHELIYLAMIESRFDPSARSSASAVGLWQFMASTARRFGLKVGDGVDQRKNPAVATDAALTYLSKLHDEFGSWYLAAAAYNSGEGTVERAMKKITGRTTGTDADFFRILPALPKETRDYVPKLIASAHVGNNPEQYGLTSPGQH